MKICTICKKKPIERRDFCGACYVRGLRHGTIQKLVKPKLPIKLTNIQEEIIVGSMLGDGCLFMPQNATNPIFSITRSQSDIEYLNWQFSIFEDFCMSGVISRNVFDKRTKKHYHQSKLVTRRAAAFKNTYEAWYYNGKKHVPSNIKLSSLICAIWFCDDGGVQLSTPQRLFLKLSTHGFLVEDVERLRDMLNNRYNEKFCIHIDKCGPIIYASDNASRAFFHDIDSVIPSSMERKAKWRNPSVKFYSGIKRAKNYITKNGKRIYESANLREA